MFFDEPKVDHVHQEFLLSVAKKQQELFLYRFDWQKRQCRPWPPKGLFGKEKKAIARYDTMLQELETLKSKLSEHRKSRGYTPGTFWWNLPWEQVVLYLMCDLEQIDESGPWRFTHKWEMHEQGDLYLLLLTEEGHCSNFTKKSSYHYEEISKYSAAEQSQMVRDYNKRLNDYELTQLMFDDRPVRSVYGTTFASMSDYMLSSDHWMYRESLESSYRRSLYTEHHTNTVTVTSNSIHYQCLMKVGGMHLRRDGVPDFVTVMDYEMVGTRGSVPGSLEEEYRQKDAAVALAAYMADDNRVKAVPVQLFGKNIVDSIGSYSEAMRQAELYTCLAHKLILEE